VQIKKLISVFVLAYLTAEIAGAQSYSGDELLIKYKNGVSKSAKSNLLRKFAGTSKKEINNKHDLVSLHQLQSVESAIEAYESDPNVEYAEPNYKVKAMGVPNDPLYTQQWPLKNTGQTISAASALAAYSSFTGWSEGPTAGANPGTSGADLGAESAWNLVTDCRTTRDGTSIVIAVVDSGVNYNHRDISANLWSGGASYPKHGKNFLSTDNGIDIFNVQETMDQGGHGTQVAGIIGAVGNNNIATSGLCWQAKIMVLKALAWDGTGTVADLVSAIDFAVANGAKIINLSLGFRSGVSTALEDAIINAKNNKILIVTAAGNDGQDNDNNPIYPCSYSTVHDNVICVGSANQSFNLGDNSAFGDSTVQLAAPGQNIVSISNGLYTLESLTEDGTYGNWSLGSNSMFNWARFTNTNVGNGWFAGNIMGINWSAPRDGFPNQLHGLLAFGNFDETMQYIGPSYPLSDVGEAMITVGEARSRSTVYDTLQLCYYRQSSLPVGDSIDVVYAGASSYQNPFSISNTVLETVQNSSAGFVCFMTETCLDNVCSVGLKGTSGALRTTSNGAVFTHFKYLHWTPDTNAATAPTTDIVSATSRSAAYVSAAAALVMSYNKDNFTYLDVKNALIEGGVSSAGLVGKTSSGRALSAIGALKHIRAPANVAVEVR
jgi:hypothetical protein